MRFDVPDWDSAIAALAGADGVALACHVNPDGDALGALMGFSIGLRKVRKKTHVSWGEPKPKVPLAYSFLPGIEALVPPDRVPGSDVFVALDCGAGDRLGLLEPTARRAKVVVNIDHHPANDEFGTLNIVVPDASSTSELVYGVLADLGVPMDTDIATCLYTGIVTDTGRFQYSNSSPDTLRLAAELLSHGVPATRIAEEVFDSAPFGYLKLVGRMLERATLMKDVEFVYSWITTEDLAETGVALDETEKLIDVLRSTRDAEVAVIFKQQPERNFRVSLRSKGRVSVGALARQRGGGGHELAAGFTAGDVNSAVEDLQRALRQEQAGSPPQAAS